MALMILMNMGLDRFPGHNRHILRHRVHRLHILIHRYDLFWVLNPHDINHLPMEFLLVINMRGCLR